MKTTGSLEKSIGGGYAIKRLLIGLFICLITLFAYRNLSDHGFSDFDDRFYVTENEHVQKGLTFENLLWAFSFSPTEEESYWLPLTWLSHMTDCQMFGLNAGLHHLTNLAIHIINALLLFIVFNQMTGALWKSAALSLLFAIHPLNVDSVAWIAERKNVLSSLFWMLTILSYIYYARRPGLARYLPVMLLFAAGLLAKPMLVTLPFVLLLLDFWPLHRVQSEFLQYSWPETNAVKGFHPYSAAKLFLEKLPLLLLALAVTKIVYLSLASHKDVISTQAVPWDLRLFNAAISYPRYLYKILWPAGLTVYYPFPRSIPAWQVIFALIGLSLMTLFVFYRIKKSPYLFTGWFWFLGTLVPVIGLIQGELWPAMADRWAYIPAIGFFIMILWGGEEIVNKTAPHPLLKGILLFTPIFVLTQVTQKQLSYWQNDITLWEHAIKVTRDNPVAHYNLGCALTKKNQSDQAMAHFKEALRIKPDYVEAHTNLGNAFHRKGRMKEAIFHYRSAVMLNPENPKARIDLANAHAAAGHLEEAIVHYTKALKIEPDNPQVHYNLGVVYYQRNQIKEAVRHLQKALALKPDYRQAKQAMDMVKKR